MKMELRSRGRKCVRGRVSTKASSSCTHSPWSDAMRGVILIMSNCRGLRYVLDVEERCCGSYKARRVVAMMEWRPGSRRLCDKDDVPSASSGEMNGAGLLNACIDGEIIALVMIWTRLYVSGCGVPVPLFDA